MAAFSRPRRRAKTTSRVARAPRRRSSRSGTRRPGSVAVREWADDLFEIAFAAVYHVHQVIGRANPGRMRSDDPLLDPQYVADNKAALAGDAVRMLDPIQQGAVRRAIERQEASLRPRGDVERARRSALLLKSRKAAAAEAIRDPSALFVLPTEAWPACVVTAARRLHRALEAEREAATRGANRLPDRLYRQTQAITLAAERLDDGLMIRGMKAWGMPEGEPMVEFVRQVLVSPGRIFSTSRVLDDIADERGSWGRVTGLADLSRRIRDEFHRLDEALLAVPYNAATRRRVMVAMLFLAEKLVRET